MKEVFIIGSKGIPAKYGGFETFVDQLTRHKNSPDIHYHVACMADTPGEFTYQDSHCFSIKVPSIGPAKAVCYDIAAFLYCLKYLKKYPAEKPVIYILACRIGPFIGFLKWRLQKKGGLLYVNPDGHEWMRAKWNAAIRRYWKFSEGLMVKHADLLICDSQNIETYIRRTYTKYRPNTTFIAYGADVEQSALSDEDASLLKWYQVNQLTPGEYYLIVGRFVPENNYEQMLTEFMNSATQKKLAIITNVEENPFYQKLKEKTGFDTDRRIRFCGTVYDQKLLKKIRERAYGYLHGHEVGGTNPSLLEALGSTSLNLLLDVGFNREVAEDTAFYWNKQPGDLAELLQIADGLSESERKNIGTAARQRICAAYSHEIITKRYEDTFLL